jgi:exosome complex component RRP46
MANLDINKAYVEVLYRPKCGIPGVNERYKEKMIRQLCESCLLTTLYPKTQINFQIQEMDDNSGVSVIKIAVVYRSLHLLSLQILACVINACNIALLNSGLEMKFCIAAVHCVIDNDDNLIVDPEYIIDETPAVSRLPKRNKSYKADFTFVFDSVNEKMISVSTNGNFTIRQYNEAQNLCLNASKKIFDFYIEMVKKYAPVI